MQKGGVIIQPGYNIDSAYNFFMTNCSVENLTYSSRGGIIFRAILTPGVASPYKSSRSNSVNVDIDVLLLKMVFLHQTKKFIIKDQYGNNMTDLSNITHQKFKDEINMQIDIFTRSLDLYLEPICPAIVDATIHPNTSPYLPVSLDQLIDKSSDVITRHILQYIKNNYLTNRFDIGIIAMECLSGYDCLSDYVDKNGGENSEASIVAKYMAMYEICRLYKLGYIHGDLHQGNLMYHPTYRYFNGNLHQGNLMYNPTYRHFNEYLLQGLNVGPTGRVMLIDFGATFRHGQPTAQPPYNFEEIYNDDLYVNCVIPSITITSPIWVPGTADTFPPYQWLKMPDLSVANLYLYKLATDRTKTKILYKIFISVGIQPLIDARTLINHPFMVGGYENNQQITMTEPIIQKQNTSENIFEKLDPNHILTLEFIKNYIKEENDFSAKILKNFEEIKGGTNKNKNKGKFSKRRVNKGKSSKRNSK